MKSEKNFNTEYRDFLRVYIDEKYLQKYNNVTVLGENFIDNYYIVLFETHENDTTQSVSKIKRYIIVENIKKPIVSEIKLLPNQDGYITMSKADLQKIIGKKLYKKLVNRGISTTKEIGLQVNNRFCWHRLVACLYYNCLEREIHHINKIKTDNNINNLIPLSKRIHQIIDKDDKNGKNLSIGIQEQEKSKIFKKRVTIASNNNVIEQIIKYSLNGFKVNEIVQKLNRIVKKSSIYKTIIRFYYSNAFMIYLNNQKQSEYRGLNGNYLKRWENIFEFEIPKH